MNKLEELYRKLDNIDNNHFKYINSIKKLNILLLLLLSIIISFSMFYSITALIIEIIVFSTLLSYINIAKYIELKNYKKIKESLINEIEMEKHRFKSINNTKNDKINVELDANNYISDKINLRKWEKIKIKK